MGKPDFHIWSRLRGNGDHTPDPDLESFKTSLRVILTPRHSDTAGSKRDESMCRSNRARQYTPRFRLCRGSTPSGKRVSAAKSASFSPLRRQSCPLLYLPRQNEILEFGPMSMAHPACVRRQPGLSERAHPKHNPPRSGPDMRRLGTNPLLNPSSPPRLGENFGHTKPPEKTMCSKGK